MRMVDRVPARDHAVALSQLNDAMAVDEPSRSTPPPPPPTGAALPDALSDAPTAAQRNAAAFLHNANVSPSPDHVASSIPTPVFGIHVRKPSAAGLHVHTELANATQSPQDVDHPSQRSSLESSRNLLTSPNFLTRTGSVRSRRSLDDAFAPFSPTSSSHPSPLLGALADVSPLPSPITRSGSPELWRRIVGRRRNSSGASTNRGGSADEPFGNFLPPAVWPVSPRKKKHYGALGSPSATPVRGSLEEPRDPVRSISDFVPDPLINVREMRNVTGPPTPTPKPEHTVSGAAQADHDLHREEFMAGRRRPAPSVRDPTRSLPSPPPSNKSTADSEDGDDTRAAPVNAAPRIIRVHSSSGRIHRWCKVRELGRGAFSEVVLATPATATTPMNDGALDEGALDRSQLVAIKIMTHDPSGGTDEERMETSIGREIEILKSLSHPCLPRLLAFDDSRARALLVLNYCPGGDLFELASQQREYLTPSLIQRIFAELVEAVGYLHSQYICHRDIKLENVLFDLPLSELPRLHHPQGLSTPLITLTDLGLAKRMPRPPESPLLTHFCGSADYAAPELLLQQPYDGRTTDMWALGVLLYALVEGRLPFDPPPGARRPGNVKHRIARCDWMWVEYGDKNGEWLDDKGAELAGARDVVDGLLKKVGRGRWSQEKTASHAWVREGITTAGRVLSADSANIPNF